MRPAHFLESLTDTYCPGRFAIKTKPIPPDLEPVQRRQWAEDQADLVVDHCAVIHEQGWRDLVGAFELLIGELERKDALANSDKLREEIFNRIKNACYPYIYVAATDIRRILRTQRQQLDTFGLMLAPRDHMSTIAEPGVLREYYIEQCRELLLHGYPLEAGLSVVPMPVIYAVERSTRITTAGKSMLEAIQSFFPAPNLSGVEDSVVDGRYRRLDESTVANRAYPLFSSDFWEEYTKYLRSGMWRHELEFPLPDTPSNFVRETLRRSQHSAQEGRRVDAFMTPIIAPRGAPEPSKEAVRAAGQAVLDPPKIEHRSNEFRHAYQTPKPLSYFDALRTHFSLSRLNYYTGTNAEFFQKNILAVNYPEYAKQFVLRALVEIHRMGREQCGKLVIAPQDQSEHPGGSVLGCDEVEKLFPPKKGEENTDDGLQDFRQVADLIKDRTAVDKLESSEAYSRCLKKVEGLIRGCEAQMPAYHYIAPPKDTPPEAGNDVAVYRRKIFEAMDLPGITMINIGVGPGNAKAITDHLAPLRPNCWILVGRCSGLRAEQHIGDYVFPTSYVRRDGVLDKRVPLDAPIKTTRAIVEAFDEATAYLSSVDKELAKQIEKQIEKQRGVISRIRSVLFLNEEGRTREEEETRFHALRQIVRLGTVISTGDRNWETAPTEELLEDFDAYRAVALDMEGGVIAANGYRYRVHHGAFLCVSAKPLDGSVRIRQIQDAFFARQTGRQLDIAVGAIRWLQYNFKSRLLLHYSRELRGGDDPPWN